ncbi:energy-coupling factor ABC transporter ATP-binding protein [Geobacter sp. DSM 9736]|uniref:energy-coupling factor ABC transporter ATP-binding protein n=1 Tax=Geobacter sp. DSM 9736 TaxID=1277350 RepID=UPI000B4FFF5C|nr:ABC transporter ATP-binding protein [Geobacter sp. DSM 9736]SNB44809.1 cobalt/nickel transport system ATP-binding protein [Geobacter sp. DSM 9736]
MDPLFSLKQINYRYLDTIPALAGVNLEIGAGQRFAVIGANGCGKSTLLQLMNGLIFPASGGITFRGYPLTEETLRQEGFLRFFRERVGYVFQDSDVQLFCPTVLDELLYGPLQLSISEEEAEQRAFEVLKMLGMENHADRPTYMLSGGEKKRVAIGSVLTMNPEALLLDEPTNGLDPRTQSFLIDLLVSLNEAGKTIILATHDLNLVADLDMHVALMSEDHRIEKIGAASEILSDEDLLLRTNLIHEHRHIHGGRSHHHRHVHVAFHRHLEEQSDIPCQGGNTNE